MSSRWAEFYQSELKNFASIEDYYINKISYKLPLLNLVSSFVKIGNTVELGCGTGLSCIYLSKLHHLGNVKVFGIDRDEEMLEIAQSFSRNLNGNVLFQKGDILNWKPKLRFEVAFNNGVMEHFSDEEIVRIIDNVFTYSSYFVFGVPTSFFSEEQAINGDERFLSVQKWLNILSQSSGRLVKYVGYDYKNSLLNKILQKINYNKYQFVAFALSKKSI